MGVLQRAGLLAPLGMILPELFADVREFDPGIDQDGVAVAGLDERSKVLIALGIRLPVMPRGDVQRGGPARAPAPGKEFGIGAEAVGGVEEEPQVAGLGERLRAQRPKRLNQIGIALVALFAQRSGGPEDKAFAVAPAGGERRAGPALTGEDARVRRQRKNRQIKRFLPNYAQFWVKIVDHAADVHAPGRGLDAVRRRFAGEVQNVEMAQAGGGENGRERGFNGRRHTRSPRARPRSSVPAD